MPNIYLEEYKRVLYTGLERQTEERAKELCEISNKIIDYVFNNTETIGEGQLVLGFALQSIVDTILTFESEDKL